IKKLLTVSQLHGIWNAAAAFAEADAYVFHLPNETTIIFGILYACTIPIAVFGFHAIRKKNSKMLQIFSKLFWLSIALLLILHLTELILSFVWRNDIIANCHKDLNYLIPSNSSTSTTPYDPDALSQNVIDNACDQ
ncbi:1817_t:CDS:2, partial [Scutellospora calospora]